MRDYDISSRNGNKFYGNHTVYDVNVSDGFSETGYHVIASFTDRDEAERYLYEKRIQEAGL